MLVGMFHVLLLRHILITTKLNKTHSLGVHIFWTYWSILMFDKPKSEYSKYFDAYEYAKFHYNYFKSQLNKLSH
nr:hypothetical protein MACL_00002686 [Theileria orientalis]